MNLLPTHGLDFPQGCAPGFDPTHPAAGPKMRFSGVAAGISFVSLFQGGKVTEAGTITKSQTLIGPIIGTSTGTSALTFPGLNETPTAVTIGAIVYPQVTETFGVIFANSNATTNVTLLYLLSLVPTVWVAGAPISSGLPALVVNTPYFVAASYNGATANFIVVNLTNGKTSTASVSSAKTLDTTSTSTYTIAGCTAPSSEQLGGGVAAAMYSINNYLSLARLQAWAAAPWDFWYPPTVVDLYSLARPPTVVSSPAYDTSLPAALARRNVDLLTGVQTGFKGAPIAPQPQWNYNEQQLLPRGRGPSVDPTSIIPGSHGAAASGPIEASLPPQGRGPPADQRTWAQAGLQGAAQQRQNDDALPPRGRGPTVDPTWVVSGQVSAALVQPVPAYDTSLPPSRRGLPIDLGTSYQAGSQGAKAQIQNDDARPLGRGSSVDILTWLVSGSHGAAAQTQNDTELPPRGRGPSVDLTWSVSGQVVVQFAQVPFYDTSLPPLGRGAAIDLRTSFQAGFLSYGASAQTQNDDSLPPLGRGPAIDLTWLESQNPGGPPAPPVVPTSVDTHDGVRHRYTASQWAQVTGWLKARRDKRKEEEAKAAAATQVAEIAIAAINEVEAPAVKVPRRPLPLSTKARRKLREALAPPPAPIVALALQTVTVLAPGPFFAERRAQLRAEWEAVLAAHEDAIEQEDEEAVIHLFMHMIGEDRLDG